MAARERKRGLPSGGSEVAGPQQQQQQQQRQQQQQDRTSRPLLRLAPAAGRCRPSLRCAAWSFLCGEKETRRTPEASSERPPVMVWSRDRLR